MRHRFVAATGLAAVVLAAALCVSAAGSATRAASPTIQPFLGEGHAKASKAATAAPAAAVAASGFQDSVVLSGLTQPTSVRFSPDGRIFVAEKSGVLKVFSSLTDTSPVTVADFSSEIHDYWDRGLLGLALDPNFPTQPYVYLLYTYDAPPGGTAPTWNDGCPTPPGPTTDGCAVTGKLIRIQLAGNTMTGTPKVLIQNEWCQQYPSHSVGDLNFGSDGYLYVTGGDGASFTFADYGQGGGGTGSPTPKNPCGDPPAGVGGSETPPTAEGGALRSQSIRRPSGEPVLLNGSLLRIDPATGAAPADNPGASASTPNARRIIAYGMRNPFRFTFRPGTSEIWMGDVGWNTWEEINRRPSPTGPVQNFGWPCYEGNDPQSGYQSANLSLCNSLYNNPGQVTAPYYTYNHSAAVVSNDGCSTANGSVVSAIGFYGGGSYPSSYNGALFFGDHSRNCIWDMPLGSNGLPDPTKLQTFVTGAANPVDIESGPGGDLFYVDFDGGAIHRITYGTTTSCSAGTFHAQYFNNTTLTGSPVVDRCEPSVNYNWGTGSPAPGVNSDQFSVRWSGQFTFNAGSYTFTSTTDDGMRVYVDGNVLIDQWKDQAATTYTAAKTMTAGTHTVTVEYYDNTGGAVAKASWVPTNANSPPSPIIDSPAPTLTYAVGDLISFSGHATDPEQGTLAASALSWTLLIHHCTTPTTCHIHNVQTWTGVSSGTFNAPDHDYPSHLELQLTATDAGGLSTTTSVLLDPKTVDLTFRSSPSALLLTVGSSSSLTPFTRTVIVNSANSISAPSPQSQSGTSYAFSAWSDAGAATHNITAPTAAATFTATYLAAAPVPGIPQNGSPPSVSGTAQQGQTLSESDGTWSGSPAPTFARQWQRCASGSCQDIVGATGTSYQLVAADVGLTVRVVVTASNSAGSSSVASAQTAVVTASSAVTLGKTAVGASTDTGWNGLKWGNKYALAAQGTVSKVSAYLKDNPAVTGAESFRAAIYADVGGVPGALRAQSSVVAVADGQAAGWVDFPVSPGVTLPAGSYWIVLQGGTTDHGALRYGDQSAGAEVYNSDAFADGLSDPFGTPKTGGWAWSLYATVG